VQIFDDKIVYIV